MLKPTKKGLDRFDKEKKELTTAYEEAIKNLNIRRAAFLKKIQDNCTHENIVITYEFDYHRREGWDIHTCGDCDKFIKKV